MVAAQHQQYFHSINNNCNPRVAFLEDFETELQGWLATGDHIVVGSDLNQHVLHDEIQELFERNQMVNVLASRHDLHTAPPML